MEARSRASNWSWSTAQKNAQIDNATKSKLIGINKSMAFMALSAFVDLSVVDCAKATGVQRLR